MSLKQINKNRVENAKLWIESCEWWIEQTLSDIKRESYEEWKRSK